MRGAIPALCVVVSLLAHAGGQIKVAILMQGSDFINVTVVPLFDVNQFDLGDVFISPCRAGTYNEARDSYCKDCSVCTAHQYEREDCIAVRNRVCLNCTICSEREQQICECNQRSQDCVTGDRVCLPLPPTSANISFDLTVSTSLSPLKERFLQEGLRTGFVLYLGEYLRHSPDSIVFMYLLKQGPRQYYTTFIVNDVYSLYTKGQVSQLTQAVVQAGLTSTFGIQSNTFSTVSQQRRRTMRRILQQQQTPIILNADRVESQCISLGACSQFFVMSHPDNPCESTCVSLPCPPGYTGIYGLCELCPNATFKSTHGNDSCTACPAGWRSDQGATNITQCWPPYTTPASTVTQQVTPSTASNYSSTHTPLFVIGSSPAPPGVGMTSGVQLPHGSTPTPVTPRSTGIQAPFMSSALATGQMSREPWMSSTRVGGIPAPATTPPPVDGGGWPPWWYWGGGVPGSTVPQQVITNNNYRIFNVTLVQKFFFSELNTGHAGTTQYIMVNEERDRWALTMVLALMVTGFLSIAAIGVRLFWLRPDHDASVGARTIVYETDDGKKVIPVPVRRPDPPPSPPHKDDSNPPPRHDPIAPRSRPFIPLGPYAPLYRRIPTEYDAPL